MAFLIIIWTDRCLEDPIIFRGLKTLTLQDPQQQSLLRLVQEGISVYSPHTAIDAVPGGMADWLCDIATGAITGHSASPELQPEEVPSTTYSSLKYPRPTVNKLDPAVVIPHSRSTIHPSPDPIPAGFESAGMGRLVTFATPQPLASLIDRVGRAAGNPAAISVAVPQSASADSMHISTVGVCPGSGAGVLMKGPRLPDVLLTGELSHHDALAAIERGSAVIALFHSNTERGYLHDVLRRKLEAALEPELANQTNPGGPKRIEEFSVDVSRKDRDPYGVAIRQM
jgi:putative NIF3 family GTP cyclohydrolase 1 type 2